MRYKLANWLCVAALAGGGCVSESPRERAQPPALEVTPEPVLQIGVDEGPNEFMFSRIVGVLRLSDGRVVVADGGSSELRFFDATGAFLFAAGRMGQGPGEFEHLFDLRRCVPDYLYAFELPWRANRFTLDGEFVDDFVLETTAGGSPYRFACNAAGQFLTISWGQPRRGTGLFASVGRLELLDTTGVSIREFGEFSVSERHGHSGGTGPHPYGKQTVLGLGARRAYVGLADADELRLFDLATSDMDRMPLLGGATSLGLSEAEVSRFREWTLNSSEPRLAAWWEEQFKTLEFPESIPAYSDLVVDSTGALWVRDFKREWDVVERWRVYSAAGDLLAILDLPTRLTVHEIGQDHLIGVWTDELGTEYVRIYELSRAPSREDGG